MRKLIVTCQCGQRMQVPRSAVGKTGMCPTCGHVVTISNDTATSTPSGKTTRPLHSRQVWWQGRVAPPEDAKRRFGEAVDLYYNGRYGEALAIFDALAKQFPGNPDIENGRTQCMAALRRPAMQIEDRSGGAPSLRDGNLDEETVRRVILEKMLHGGTEAIQLQAAELAARLLGMFPGGPKPTQEASAPQEPEKNDLSEAEGTENREAVAGPDAEHADNPTPGSEVSIESPRDEIQARRLRGIVPNESDLERARRRAMRL